MILGDNRKVVIDNIKDAVKDKDFNRKVEVNDPELSIEEKKKIIYNYLEFQKSPIYVINNKIARGIAASVTHSQNKTTKIIGMENVKDIQGGAIITSNHFNQLDNIVIRKFAKKAGKKRLYIVGQETNLAMKGLVGYMMNFMDIIPISDLTSYMKKDFQDILKKKLYQDNFILIYPEQEMWFNYKKPRTAKPGAYYYAAKFNVPIISCFVEIKNTNELETEEFYKVEYILHVLPPIYPDEEKSIKENSAIMMEQDCKQKKEAYETAYKKELNYDFDLDDIAGLSEQMKKNLE